MADRPRSWGLATRDKSQKPEATPTLDHVLSYDLEIRKKVAWHMNRGIDLRKSFKLATEDEKLQRTAFLNYVSLEIALGKCRAITAPGMREVHSGLTQVGTPQGQKRALEDSGGGLSKAQLNKIKQQAKRQALEEARRQFAAHPLPPPHGAQRPSGQGVSKEAQKRARAAALRDAVGAAGGAGGGGGAQRAIQNGVLGDGQAKGAGKGGKGGKGASYAWNDGNPCKQAPCPFAHICSKCGGQHKRDACPNNGA